MNSRSVALALAGLLAAGSLGACATPGSHLPATEVKNGDPVSGKQAIVAYGCGSCHTIPGVRGADGLVGPPLTAFGRRSYIAGELPNNAENLQYWIRDPQAVEPGTAMPDLGIGEIDARDIAAYLLTLG